MSEPADDMGEINRAESLDADSLSAIRTLKRDPYVDALERAAIRLRDAEIEKQAAGKAYGEALEAFNRFVAPVSKP